MLRPSTVNYETYEAVLRENKALRAKLMEMSKQIVEYAKLSERMEERVNDQAKQP